MPALTKKIKILFMSFLNNNGSGKHLLIFGSKKSGKTSISVAIGTEKSIKHNTCIYTTAIKLYSMFCESEEKLLKIEDSLWTWRTASLLIIDDINPGEPITEELVSATQFLNFIDANNIPNLVNRKIVKEKNVIWVLGNEDPENKLLDSWQNMLLQIGVKVENISAIHL